MKKTYSNPTIEVIAVKTQQFMMMSILGETNSTSGNLARDNDFDDEE